MARRDKISQPSYVAAHVNIHIRAKFRPEPSSGFLKHTRYPLNFGQILIVLV